MKKLTRNAFRCKKCLDVIESKYHHDFKYCKCGSIFVDGGLEYSRGGWPGGDINDWVEDLCEYEELPDPPKTGMYGLLLDTDKDKIIGGKLEE